MYLHCPHLPAAPLLVGAISRLLATIVHITDDLVIILYDLIVILVFDALC